MGRSVQSFQTNFTSGELDPKLAPRHDIKFYTNGADNLDNLWVRPQGGAYRRPGSRFAVRVPKPLSDLNAGNGEELIPYGDGSVIATGDKTWSNTAESANGDTDVGFADTATVPYGASTPATQYIGKDWGVGNTNTVSKAVWYGPNNNLLNAGFETMDITLQGSTDNFSSSVVDLGSELNYVPDTSAGEVFTLEATDISTAYRYHRLKIYSQVLGFSLYVAELEFYRIPAGVTASATDPDGNGGTPGNAINDNDDSYVENTVDVGTTDDYIVVRVDLGESKDITFVDLRNWSLVDGSTPSSTEFDVEYSTNDSDWSVFSNVPISDGTERDIRLSNGTLTVVSARYWRLIRNGTTDLGTAEPKLGEMRFFEELDGEIYSRLIPFEFSTTQNYMLCLSDQNIMIIKGGNYLSCMRSPYTGEQLSGINWTQSADTLITVHEDVNPHTFVRDSTYETVWASDTITFDYIPTFDFVPGTRNVAGTVTPGETTGTVNLAGSGSDFAASDVGQIFEGNGGLARIVRYTSATSVDAVVIIPFWDNSTGASGCVIHNGFEDAWSSTRGYPVSVSFHEGRLWFGGAKGRPHTIWGSRVDDFYNFDIGQSLDDEAIEITLDTDQINSIINLYSGRDLQVFTHGAEFYVTQKLFEPITPGSIGVKRQTSLGSKSALRVVEIEGGTLFIQRGGNAVREFLFSDIEQAYQSQNVSLLASHLISDPVDFGLRIAAGTDDTNIMLIVNDDGTLTTCSTLRSQEITAFSQSSFANAEVKNCAAVKGDDNPIFIVTERTIDSSVVRYVEQLRDDYLLDAAHYEAVTSGTTSFSANLDHLEGQTVTCVIDGSTVETHTVTNGAITTTATVNTDIHIGETFLATGQTMPVENTLENGTNRTRKKRIVEATVWVNETSNISINGDALVVPSAEYTGHLVIEGILGYDEDAQITFSQTQPLPFEVLGIGYEVST